MRICTNIFAEADLTMELISRALLLGLVLLAGVLLFSPYEAYLEGAIATGIIGTAAVGFLMHPRREVFHVRTRVRTIGPDRKQRFEQDLLAVKVELVRLWLLFVPTSLAVAFLVFFAAGGPVKFSSLNWLFSSRYGYAAVWLVEYTPLLVIFLLFAWIEERRVLRNADACSARSFSLSQSRIGWLRRVSYLFMGEHDEYYAGYCFYSGLVRPRELATIVFHNVERPELNKIAMGFLFHDVSVLGRGVTDLDEQTAATHTQLAQTTSVT